TILGHISNCKTAALGGHKTTCTACQNEVYSYNSCGDANCPNCQNVKKQLWIDKMSAHLLPVKHFHIIFTLPHQLNDLIFYNKKTLFGLLFRTAWQAIQEVIGGGRTGMVATLHSWGSNLSVHPHLHCIVPAGSYKEYRWQSSNSHNPRFFCEAKLLRESFKKCYLKAFLRIIEEEDLRWRKYSIEEEDIFPKIQQIVKTISRKKWTVRIENPVLGTEQIIEYLARYVRRVAITNSRIEQVTTDKVVINYKVYAKQKTGKPPPIEKMSFDGATFLQRLCQHFMPRSFHKVRYYGCYSFAAKKLKAAIYTQITGQTIALYQPPDRKAIITKMLGHDPDICTNCGVMGEFVTEGLVNKPEMLFRLTSSPMRPIIRAGPLTTQQKEVP
ncbi:MAG: transposase, partial [Cocleimonas sp.]|nr:transposase [Cocleimonas sp.]